MYKRIPHPTLDTFEIQGLAYLDRLRLKTPIKNIKVNNLSFLYLIPHYKAGAIQPTLKTKLKQKLVSISACAIRSCMYHPDNMISYENLHKMNNRAMPNAIMLYKCAIQLFKIYNANAYMFDYLINFNQTTSRQTTFTIVKSNSTKVGLNIIANRLSIINGKIPFN